MAPVRVRSASAASAAASRLPISSPAAAAQDKRRIPLPRPQCWCCAPHAARGVYVHHCGCTAVKVAPHICQRAANSNGGGSGLEPKKGRRRRAVGEPRCSLQRAALTNRKSCAAHGPKTCVMSRSPRTKSGEGGHRAKERCVSRRARQNRGAGTRAKRGAAHRSKRSRSRARRFRRPLQARTAMTYLLAKRRDARPGS